MVATKKSKKSVKKVPTATRAYASKESFLAIVAFILPFFAWLTAAIVNPDGWASENPTIVLTVFVTLVVSFWPFALLSVVLLVALYFIREKPPFKHVAAILLAVSVIYSAYLYNLTATTDESEFAG